MNFNVPAGYLALPVGMTRQEAREMVLCHAHVEGREDAPDEKAVAQAAANLHNLSQGLRFAGAVYAGFYLHEHEGQLSLGSLTVAARPASHGAIGIAVAGMVSAFGQRGRGSQVMGKPFELPCGKAAVFTSEFAYVIPGSDLPQGEDVSIVLQQLQAFIPVPREVAGGQEAVTVVTVLTPSQTHWELYARHAVDVLQSLEFDEMDSRPG